MTQDAREKLARAAMEKFRRADRQHDHIAPWVGFKEGFLAGYSARDAYIAQLEKVAEAARYMHRFCTNAYSDYEGDLILQYESAVKALDAIKKGEAP